MLYKFRTINSWFALYLHIYNSDLLVFPAKLSHVSPSIDICNAAIKSNRNMNAVLTNPSGIILRFNVNTFLSITENSWIKTVENILKNKKISAKKPNIYISNSKLGKKTTINE